MSKPVLVIVTGLPAAGKTTLACALADGLALPLVAKDDLKAIMFDNLGWSDRGWSVKVGITAFRILDYIVEGQLKQGNSLLLESPFDPGYDNERFQRWQQIYGYRCIQVVCSADRKTIIRRFKERAASATRHPGHVEAANMQDFEAELATRPVVPLDLNGPVIRLDTTDFASVDVPALVQKIRQAMHD